MKAVRVLGLGILFSSLLLDGCAPTITPQEQASAAAVDPLTDKQARNVVLDWIRDLFYDRVERKEAENGE
jgi:hypothetical protein